jgi:hypothetical protein
MSEYPSGSLEDRKMLEAMPNDKLLDFLFLQVRNLWRVDGLYFLDIEKKSGTEAAATSTPPSGKRWLPSKQEASKKCFECQTTQSYQKLWTYFASQAGLWTNPSSQ